MGINEIVEQLFKEGRFKAFCLSLAKNSTKAEELHSMLIEVLLSNPQSAIDAHRDGCLDYYCVDVIRKIWGKRTRYKITTGQTSDLLFYSDTCPEGIKFATPTNNYDYTIEYKAKKAQDIIKEEFFHRDKDRMYKARVFYYSQPIQFIKKEDGSYYNTCKTPAEFSRKLGIHYQAIIKARHSFVKFLKFKLK